MTLQSGTVKITEGGINIQRVNPVLQGMADLEVELDDSSYFVSLGGSNPNYSGDVDPRAR